jgi:cell division protein FtsI (penicillin-binding protein 3)
MSTVNDIPRSRIIILLVAFILFSMAVGYRVFSFQIVHGLDLSEQAQSFRFREDVVPPERGDILDHRGRKLATNVPADRVSVIVHQLDDPRETAYELARIIDRDYDDIYEAISHPDREWVVLQRRLSQEASQQIEALNMDGIVLDPEPRRIYPMGSFASQVLGFVNYDYEGAYGIEGIYHDVIAGEPGHLIGERDGAGNVIALGHSTWDPAKDGADLILTIDSSVQRIVEEALAEAIDEQDAAGGTIIVQNPKTGAILGMASHPSYDPNHFDRVEEIGLFSNPAISANFEPGSTMKAIVMAIGLEAGVVQPHTVHPGGPYRELPGGERVYNATLMDFGPETMTEVLEHSSNVGAMYVAELLGEDDLYRGLTAFGFGEETGIDLHGEESGIFPLPGDPVWTLSNLYTNSFGQGMAVTPIQITNAMSALANGGTLLEPYIVDEIRYPDGDAQRTEPAEIRQVISPETSQSITRMLTSVVETGQHVYGVPGYDIAGKTGTAQIPAIEGGYEPGATIGSIVGYGPSDDPQFTVLVKIDRPQGSQWGERAAGPAFKRVFEELFLLYGIPPNHPDQVEETDPDTEID